MRGAYAPIEYSDIELLMKSIRTSEASNSLKIPLLITIEYEDDNFVLLNDRNSLRNRGEHSGRPGPFLVLPSFESSDIPKKSSYTGLISEYFQKTIFPNVPNIHRNIFPLGIYKKYATDIDKHPESTIDYTRGVTQIPANVILSQSNQLLDMPTTARKYRYFHGNPTWTSVSKAHELLDEQAARLPEDNLALDALDLILLYRNSTINS